MTEPSHSTPRGLRRTLSFAALLVGGATVVGLALRPASTEPLPTTAQASARVRSLLPDARPPVNPKPAEGLRVFDGTSRRLELRFSTHARELTRDAGAALQGNRRLEVEQILRRRRPTVVVVAAHYCNACKRVLRAMQAAALPAGVDLLVWTDYTLPEKQRRVIDALGARPARLIQGGASNAELIGWIDAMFPDHANEIPVIAVLDGQGRVLRAFQSGRIEVVEQIVKAASGMPYDDTLPDQTITPLPLPVRRPSPALVAAQLPGPARRMLASQHEVAEPDRPAMPETQPDQSERPTAQPDDLLSAAAEDRPPPLDDPPAETRPVTHLSPPPAVPSQRMVTDVMGSATLDEEAVLDDLGTLAERDAPGGSHAQ